ncbi:hypothetical protein FTUN_8366 [Frigoriglobus tundricola]|uniref:Uncharacterized protein n=1 Tax=Frigoriglobus tundricola TaxID=2774151 RepID=A0A6M5Z5M1_9BACT|nr:hypothetical protein FTUN_8366 [Frigoriglobus tundricola]
MLGYRIEIDQAAVPFVERAWLGIDVCHLNPNRVFGEQGVPLAE